MKTKLTFIFLLIVIGYSSFSQIKNSDTSPLIREEMNSSINLRFSYIDKDWNNKFEPSLHDLGYDIISMNIDTSIVYPLMRKMISNRYFTNLNKERWYIYTKLTGYGQIVSVSFWFKDESGFNNHEFAILAEQLKKEVKWKLTFNKEVKDLFYLQSSIQGPKL